MHVSKESMIMSHLSTGFRETEMAHPADSNLRPLESEYSTLSSRNKDGNLSSDVPADGLMSYANAALSIHELKMNPRNIIAFPKLTYAQRAQHVAGDLLPRRPDLYRYLGDGYECRLMSAASVIAGKPGRLDKIEAANTIRSPKHLLLNVFRSNETIAASLIINISLRIVEAIGYDTDVLGPEDTSAIARLLASEDWSKTYRVPREIFLYSTDGQSHSFRNMPKKLCLRGDLHVVNADNVRFPESLSVSGLVFIANSHVAKAPLYLECGTLEIADSWMPTIASVLKADQVEVTQCSIDKFCGIGNVSGDVVIKQEQMSFGVPSALRVGGDLTISSESLTHMSSNIVVMGAINPVSAAPLPWSTDFLGRVLKPGDFVKVLDHIKVVREGKEVKNSLLGYCAQYKGTDADNNALLSLEDDDGEFLFWDFIPAPGSALLKVDAQEYEKHSISYNALFSGN